MKIREGWKLPPRNVTNKLSNYCCWTLPSYQYFKNYWGANEKSKLATLHSGRRSQSGGKQIDIKELKQNIQKLLLGSGMSIKHGFSSGHPEKSITWKFREYGHESSLSQIKTVSINRQYERISWWVLKWASFALNVECTFDYFKGVLHIDTKWFHISKMNQKLLIWCWQWNATFCSSYGQY